MVQWLRLQAPNAGGMGLIPGQGTTSHMLTGMPQLRILIKNSHEDPTCRNEDPAQANQ